MKSNLLKKTFLTICITAAIAVIYSFVPSEKSADTTLSNIEALSQGSGGEGGGGDATITCSRSCRDGIGQCWIESDGGCQRTDSQHNHCTC